MFPEAPEILLCELLLTFFPLDQFGNARFVERLSIEESEIGAYGTYHRVAVQVRDSMQKVSNEDVDKVICMSDTSWDTLIEFVVSQKGYRPSGGALTRERKGMVLYKLFCIVVHDLKSDAKGKNNMKNMQSYKSFVVFGGLHGKKIIELQHNLHILAKNVEAK